MLEMGEDERCAGDATDLPGLAVMGRRMRQRPVSRANPRSPRQRSERSRALRVRVLTSRSCPAAGGRTGM